MNLRQMATGLSLYLVRQVDLPEERVDSLRFGLEIIIGSGVLEHCCHRPNILWE
ncbi:MAG: hypothetical protein U1D96_09625 [Eubacteriales bacterium]|jgi:hypothetical protein|nr:hypothetical protein [Bacillota bacterium]MBV1770584.1 hypothetical protein [Desulforudis sp.]MDZ4043724.1 hypothetical protein [Eubacteriales bacterium]MDZ7609730.1 hypothetical protein [Eubacteriales bacterium]